MKKISVTDIQRMKADGEKIPVLTSYSYPFARIVDSSGVPVIMVGDSVGMVEAGHANTLPVTVDEMVYHTRAVARAAAHALVVADMPFASYQISTEEAVRNAARLVKEGGAEAVKLEGGRTRAGAIRAIVDMGVPVMAHVGLTPQSVHALGGFTVQGRTRAAAEVIIEDARAVEEAGAFSVVLEGVPASVAAEITALLTIPTIGIGAGPDCDGQVLVINDMLGLNPGYKLPKFVRQYADIKKTVGEAIEKFAEEVRSGAFPSENNSYR
jgi:3-methyl-2-oxobutanoate hydroxymethyltransferase